MPDVPYAVSPPVQDNDSANMAGFTFFGLSCSASPKMDAFGILKP